MNVLNMPSLSEAEVDSEIAGTVSTSSGGVQPVKLSSLVLPPKEPLCIMSWLFAHPFSKDDIDMLKKMGADAYEGLESVVVNTPNAHEAEVKKQVLEIQGYVERAEPLDIWANSVTPEAMIHFLLRWLTCLPRPCINKECLRQYTMEKKTIGGAVRDLMKDGSSTYKAAMQMDVLSRSVVCCIGSLLSHLQDKAGIKAGDPVWQGKSALVLFASALTHNAILADDAQEFLQRLISEFDRSSNKTEFPPKGALHRIGCVKKDLSSIEV